MVPRSLTVSGQGPRGMPKVSEIDEWGALSPLSGEHFPHSAVGLEEQSSRGLPEAGDLSSGSESEVTQVCAQPVRVISSLLFPTPPQIFLCASGLGGSG